MIASLVALILKRQGSEYTLIISVCAVVLILVYVLSSVTLSIDYVKTLFSNSYIDSVYLQTLLKCMGICFVTEFTCDCCKDASQLALSGTVLLCGRICVLVAAMPLFTEFLSVSMELSGGRV